jgi:hypothetical protein
MAELRCLGYYAETSKQRANFKSEGDSMKGLPSTPGLTVKREGPTVGWEI